MQVRAQSPTNDSNQVVGSPPPGMELFNMHDSNDEVVSDKSMDNTYHEEDTPARRRHTQTMRLRTTKKRVTRKMRAFEKLLT